MSDSPFDSVRNIAEAFYNIAADYPDRVLYSQAVYDGTVESETPRTWVSTDYKTAKSKINKIANYLNSIDVTKGTKVAIISCSRPEWLEADIAILSAGGVVVSVYQTLPAAEIAYILFDSGAKIVFAENQEQVNKILEINSQSWDMPATEIRGESKEKINIEHIICFERCETNKIVTQYEGLIMGPEQLALSGMLTVQRKDIASLVYTSGTTGPPKGVIQSHHNHLSNVRQAIATGLFSGESSFMLFLPLAHSFAKLMGYLGFLTPAELKFLAVIDPASSQMDPKSVTRDIREGSASIVPVVPRLLEKMKAAILLKTEAKGIAPKLLKATVAAALAKQTGKETFKSKIIYSLTGGLRKKVREKLFGPDLAYGLSGGAKLTTDVANFFAALEIPILEGYGLTETCVATNINRLSTNKIGTVGPVLDDDIEVKIVDDGEIHFRGPNIALGYNNRPTATRESWDSKGWFHTGDLGEIDEDGFLSITGRKKELLVASTGKKIAPQDIEDTIKISPYVSQVVMIGDARSYCTAIVTMEQEAVVSWCNNQKITITKEMHTMPEIHNLLWQAVEKANVTRAGFEQIKKISIAPEDFTVENGLLTPTFKVKKKIVIEMYKDLVDEMYR